MKLYGMPNTCTQMEATLISPYYAETGESYGVTKQTCSVVANTIKEFDDFAEEAVKFFGFVECGKYKSNPHHDREVTHWLLVIDSPEKRREFNNKQKYYFNKTVKGWANLGNYTPDWEEKLKEEMEKKKQAEIAAAKARVEEVKAASAIEKTPARRTKKAIVTAAAIEQGIYPENWEDVFK